MVHRHCCGFVSSVRMGLRINGSMQRQDEAQGVDWTGRFVRSPICYLLPMWGGGGLVPSGVRLARTNPQTKLGFIPLFHALVNSIKIRTTTHSGSVRILCNLTGSPNIRKEQLEQVRRSRLSHHDGCHYLSKHDI